nr:MAG TPA: hypothetical protein [Caudoviricetes sp.]
MKRKRRTHLRFKTSVYHNKDTNLEYCHRYTLIMKVVKIMIRNMGW